MTEGKDRRTVPSVDGAITSCPSTCRSIPNATRRSRRCTRPRPPWRGPASPPCGRECVPGTVAEPDHLVGPGHQLEPLGHDCDQRQARSGHRPVVFEGHCKARRSVRFCVHRKDTFLLLGMVWTSQVTSSQDRGHFPRMVSPQKTGSWQRFRWIELNVGLACPGAFSAHLPAAR